MRKKKKQKVKDVDIIPGPQKLEEVPVIPGEQDSVEDIINKIDNMDKEDIPDVSQPEPDSDSEPDSEPDPLSGDCCAKCKNWSVSVAVSMLPGYCACDYLCKNGAILPPRPRIGRRSVLVRGDFFPTAVPKCNGYEKAEE